MPRSFHPVGPHIISLNACLKLLRFPLLVGVPLLDVPAVDDPDVEGELVEDGGPSGSVIVSA